MSDVEFDQDELRLLRAGLLEWGGPASPTDALARALGFSGSKTMSGETRDLWSRIERGDQLEAGEWRRVLLAVEIVFASDVVGSGIDWSITTGIPDVEAIAVLRRLQRKLPRWRGSAQFTVGDDGRLSINDPERPPP
ncbi:MAG: hypothetical protein ACJ72E_11270 [Marmoricola sp.]